MLPCGKDKGRICTEANKHYGWGELRFFYDGRGKGGRHIISRYTFVSRLAIKNCYDSRNYSSADGLYPSAGENLKRVGGKAYALAYCRAMPAGNKT